MDDINLSHARMQQVVDFVYAREITHASRALWDYCKQHFSEQTQVVLQDLSRPDKTQRKLRTGLLHQMDDAITFDNDKELIIAGQPLIDLFKPNMQMVLHGINLQLYSGMCNYNCVFCNQEKTAIAPPNADILKDMFYIIKKHHVENIKIQGGEPTIIPEFRQFALSLESTSCRVDIITNGYCFDEFWQNYCLNKSNEVSISLNAASKDLYARICNKDGFDVVIDNITSFVRKRAVFPGKKPKLNLTMVVFEETWPEVLSFIFLAKKLGADSIYLGVYVDGGTSILSKSPKQAKDTSALMFFEELLNSPDALALLAPEILYNLANQIGYPIDLVHKKLAACKMVNKKIHKSHCWKPWQQVFINENVVSVCCYSKYILGDLRYDSLEYIVNNIPSCVFRSRMLHGDYGHCSEMCEIAVTHG